MANVMQVDGLLSGVYNVGIFKFIKFFIKYFTVSRVFRWKTVEVLLS